MTKKKKKKINKEKIESEVIKEDVKINENEVSIKKEDNNYFEILDKEKRHPLLKFMIVLLIIAICLLIFYKLVIWNNKGIFSSGINYSYSTINKLINKLNENNILSKSTELDGVLKINTNDTKYNDLNKYQFNLNTSIDLGSNKFKNNIDIIKDNNSLLDLSYNYQNSNDYLTLNNIYDKTIKLVNSNPWITLLMSNAKKIDYNKLGTSLNTIKGIINDNIDRNSLKNGQENIVIDDKTYDLNYVSLNLSKEEYSKLLVKIINNIEDNHKLINDLVDALDTSENTIVDNLNEILKNVLIADFNNLEIKVYVDGYMAKVVGIGVNMDDVDVFRSINVNYNKINHVKYNNYDVLMVNNNVTVKDNDNKILTANINENSSNTLDIDYVYDNENKYYGNIHVDKNKVDNNIHGSASFSLVTDKSINYSFNYDYTLRSDINIDDVNESNVIDMSNLSEDDYLNIYKQLKDKTKDTIFDSYINSFVEGLLKY